MAVLTAQRGPFSVLLMAEGDRLGLGGMDQLGEKDPAQGQRGDEPEPEGPPPPFFLPFFFHGSCLGHIKNLSVFLIFCPFCQEKICGFYGSNFPRKRFERNLFRIVASFGEDP
jgi:hypothetical protein